MNEYDWYDGSILGERKVYASEFFRCHKLIVIELHRLDCIILELECTFNNVLFLTDFVDWLFQRKKREIVLYSLFVFVLIVKIVCALLHSLQVQSYWSLISILVCLSQKMETPSYFAVLFGIGLVSTKTNTSLWLYCEWGSSFIMIT